jgi:hypothetical protein
MSHTTGMVQSAPVCMWNLRYCVCLEIDNCRHHDPGSNLQYPGKHAVCIEYCEAVSTGAYACRPVTEQVTANCAVRWQRPMLLRVCTCG